MSIVRILRTALLNRIALYVAIVAIPRLILIVFYPEIAGDTVTYKNVAENVLRGCGLSMSPADGPECVPHQGGQNFPGLPLFISFVWLVFGRSDQVLLLAQLAFYLAAVAWLLVVITRFENGKRVAAVVAFLLAVSPLTMPWVRFIAITEALSLTASIWVLAEILLALHAGRLHGVRLALAFTAAVFMRAENVLFVLPIALAAFYTRRTDLPRQALLFGVTAAIPFVAFATRNVLVGLPPVSPPAVLYRYALPVYPSGFHAWLNTWMVTEYERADAIMPMWSKLYSRIRVQHSAFIASGERTRADSLLRELSAYDGQPFPIHIDRQFAELARAKRQSQPVADRLAIYLKRVRALWLNPYSSYGFPIETENRDHRTEILRTLEQPGVSKYARILWEYPSLVIGRGLILFYKAVLMIGFVAALATFQRADPLTRKITMIVTLALATRTLFFVMMGNPPQIEARFMVSVIPWLEVLVGLAVVGAIYRRSMRRATT